MSIDKPFRDDIRTCCPKCSHDFELPVDQLDDILKSHKESPECDVDCPKVCAHEARAASHALTPATQSVLTQYQRNKQHHRDLQEYAYAHGATYGECPLCGLTCVERTINTGKYDIHSTGTLPIMLLRYVHEVTKAGPNISRWFATKWCSDKDNDLSLDNVEYSGFETLVNPFGESTSATGPDHDCTCTKEAIQKCGKPLVKGKCSMCGGQ